MRDPIFLPAGYPLWAGWWPPDRPAASDVKQLEIVASLTDEELRVAVAHEGAHLVVAWRIDSLDSVPQPQVAVMGEGSGTLFVGVEWDDVIEQMQGAAREDREFARKALRQVRARGDQ